MHWRRASYLLSLAILVFVGVSQPLAAQFDAGGFQLIPELGQLGNQGGPDHQLQVRARLRTASGVQVGLLEVTATMNPTWHIYSLTQKSGGPTASKIQLEGEGGYRLLGSFAPQKPPKVHFEPLFKMDVEEFSGEVTWVVPVSWTGAPPSISGYIDGQVCADGGACVPVGKDETSFTAEPEASLSAEVAQSLTGVQQDGTHSPIRSWLSSTHVRAGEPVQLNFAFDPAVDWHVYAYAPAPPSPFQKPTLIEAQLPAPWELGSPKSAAPIISKESALPGDPPLRYYDGPVTISVPIQVPPTTATGEHVLRGFVGYQTCAVQCDRPIAIAWEAKVEVSAELPETPRLAAVTLDPAPADYEAVAQRLGAGSKPTDPQVAVAAIDDLEVEDDESLQRGLVAILGFAFVGGFILNFMPCVLPVIGLKIMSFVEQAGSNRVRVFGLNAWYALGMLSVFWILAALAAAPALGLSEQGLGWGQQFNYQGFAIPLVCLVFVMGLSFLGVWEIPIPGFATGSQASALADKEGYSGAFFKGAITTVLATPCSAPGLATAYGWAVQSESVSMAFLVFTVMGLGMALPYLMIGVFPSLIRFLPKPGAWMDTFKQLMGFVLLGTVIFLMQNVTWSLLLPTLAMLFGLWFACWWIGRVPLTAEPAQRWRAWGVAAAIALATATFSFGHHIDAFGRSFRGIRGWAERKFELEVDRIVGQRTATLGVAAAEREVRKKSANELPWEPFSQELLDDLRGSQTTVMIDFTADW